MTPMDIIVKLDRLESPEHGAAIIHTLTYRHSTGNELGCTS